MPSRYRRHSDPGAPYYSLGKYQEVGLPCRGHGPELDRALSIVRRLCETTTVAPLLRPRSQSCRAALSALGVWSAASSDRRIHSTSSNCTLQNASLDISRSDPRDCASYERKPKP
jgi:hypothetical protein